MKEGVCGVLRQTRVEEICNAYYNDVFRFCLFRTGEQEAAAELTQETFLLLQQKAPALEDTAVKAWLYRTAHNLSLAFHRARRKRLLTEVDLALAEERLELQIETSREGEIDDETLLEIGTQILRSLGQEDQALYRMRYRLHMKYAEIAAALGISENTAQVRAFRLRARVLQQIRAKLEGREDAVWNETTAT